MQKPLTKLGNGEHVTISSAKTIQFIFEWILRVGVTLYGLV